MDCTSDTRTVGTKIKSRLTVLVAWWAVHVRRGSLPPLYSGIEAMSCQMPCASLSCKGPIFLGSTLKSPRMIVGRLG
eukprot:3796986-Alexandrium_andersonii.AAC.1